MNAAKRKFKLLISLGFKKSVYVWLYRFFGLFSQFYKNLEYSYRNKRWITKIIALKEQHQELLKNNLSREQKKQISNFYRKFDISVNDEWHLLYTRINGSFSKKYIPENLFFMDIEPALNDMDKHSVYTDKNLYQKIYPSKYQPETLLRCMNGGIFDKNYGVLSEKNLENLYDANDGTYILKPSRNTFGGKNIYLAEVKNSCLFIEKKPAEISNLRERFKGNFIIQKYVQQHKDIDGLNSSSLNTTRIITLRLDQKIHHLSSFLRLGASNQLVDNLSSGGIGIGIHHDGKISSAGINISLELTDNVPDSIKYNQLAYYPHFHEMINATLTLHEQLIDFDLVSWDMVIDEYNQPVMIENNLSLQDSIIHQVLNGPLFGDYTEDVLAEVVRRKKRIRK